MKRLILAALLVLAACDSSPTAPSSGSTMITKDGYVAAATEADLDTALGFAASGDKAAWNQFLAKGRITLLKPGTPVTIEQCLGLACSKVKARAQGETNGFYTTSAALEK